VLVDVVDVDDVGVVEQGADPRLVEEHVDDPDVGREVRLEPLDHDLLVEPGHRGLAREIDLGHAAGREPAHQAVALSERDRLFERGSPSHGGNAPSGEPATPAWAASVAAIASSAPSATLPSTAWTWRSGSAGRNASSTSVIPPPRPARS